MAENPYQEALSLRGLSQQRMNALSNYLEAGSAPGFLQTPAGQRLLQVREDAAEPVEQAPLPPQFGSGSLGALAAFAAAAQGPQAVVRQGDRIAKSAAERRQVERYNQQRVDAHTERLGQLDMVTVQMMHEQARTNQQAETEAWNKLQSSIVTESAEAQRLAEAESATEEDRRRYEETFDLEKRVKTYQMRAKEINDKFERRMAERDMTLAEAQDARQQREHELTTLRLEMRLGDPLDALTDGQREMYAQAQATAHEVTSKYLGALDGNVVSNAQGQPIDLSLETEADVAPFLRKLRESLEDHVGGFRGGVGVEGLIDKVVADQANRAVMRIYERADLGEIGLIGRADIPKRKRETEGEFEVRREQSEAVALQRMPKAMERLASTLQAAGISTTAEQLHESMPRELHDAWIEADILGETISESLARKHRDWFEQNQVPMPGERLPGAFSKFSADPTDMAFGDYRGQVPLQATTDVFGTSSARGKVRLSPSKLAGQDFPDDPFSVGQGQLLRSSRIGADAPPSLDPFPEDREDFAAMLEVHAKLTTDLFLRDPSGFTTEDLVGKREEAREQMLKNKASQVQ